MIKKVFFTFIIIILIFTLFSNYKVVQASGISGIINSADNFINAGRHQRNTINIGELRETSNLVYNTFLLVGICIAVIVGTILGIQFITGSVEQKVKVQEALLPFIVGCVVIFGAFGIWKLVITIIR